jgi:hypothetical protein
MEAAIVVCCILLILAPLFALILVMMLPFCPQSDTAGYWKRFPYVVLQLIGIQLLFAAVTGVLLANQMRSFFLEHFDEYRCKPWFMPFVSFVRPDISPADNFMSCMNDTCRSVFASMTAPFVGLADALGNGMNLAGQNFAQVQRHHLNLGNDMVHMLGQSNNTLGKYQALSTYVFMKVKAIFDKLMTTILDVYYALITMLDLVNIAILTPQLMIAGVFLTAIASFAASFGLVIMSTASYATSLALASSFFFAYLAPPFAVTGAIQLMSSFVPFMFGTLLSALWQALQILDAMALKDSDRHHIQESERRRGLA